MTNGIVQFIDSHPQAHALLLFSPAGSGAYFYRHWAKQLGAGVHTLGIQLPGREGRYREPRATDFSALVAQLAEAIQERVKGRYSIFGHSLGAALGFAVGEALERQYGRAAETIFVSARKVPSARANFPIDPNVADRELIDFLLSIGGIPAGIVNNAEVMNLYLPIFRDDFRLNISANAHPFHKVSANLVTLGGSADVLARPEDMEKWSAYSSKDCSIHIYPGGHFFITEHERSLLTLLTTRLHPLTTA